MAANTAEVRQTALSLDAAFTDECPAPRPGGVANGRHERLVAVRRDHTRIVAAASPLADATNAAPRSPATGSTKVAPRTSDASPGDASAATAAVATPQEAAL